MPRIYPLRIPFQIPLGPKTRLDRFVYAFIVRGDDAIGLVDSGVAGSERAIFEEIAEMRRRPGEVSTLLLTHAHPDHIGAAPAIRSATGCVVAAHPEERRWIEDVALQERERAVPGFRTLAPDSVRVDREVNEGDELDFGGVSLRVLHTPGHSKGSISLWLEEERTLICGDAVLVPGGLPIYDDPVTAARSVKRLMEIERVRVLYSSWDSPREGADAARVMKGSLEYLRSVHAAVLECAGRDPQPDPKFLCARVCGKLGLPKTAVNPLVARSFMANLAARDQTL